MSKFSVHLTDPDLSATIINKQNLQVTNDRINSDNYTASSLYIKDSPLAPSCVTKILKLYAKTN